MHTFDVVGEYYFYNPFLGLFHYIAENNYVWLCYYQIRTLRSYMLISRFLLGKKIIPKVAVTLCDTTQFYAY